MHKCVRKARCDGRSEANDAAVSNTPRCEVEARRVEDITQRHPAPRFGSAVPGRGVGRLVARGGGVLPVDLLLALVGVRLPVPIAAVNGLRPSGAGASGRGGGVEGVAAHKRRNPTSQLFGEHSGGRITRRPRVSGDCRGAPGSPERGSLGNPSGIWRASLGVGHKNRRCCATFCAGRAESRVQRRALNANSEMDSQGTSWLRGTLGPSPDRPPTDIPQSCKPWGLKPNSVRERKPAVEVSLGSPMACPQSAFGCGEANHKAYREPRWSLTKPTCDAHGDLAQTRLASMPEQTKTSAPTCSEIVRHHSLATMGASRESLTARQTTHTHTHMSPTTAWSDRRHLRAHARHAATTFRKHAGPCGDSGAS